MLYLQLTSPSWGCSVRWYTWSACGKVYLFDRLTGERAVSCCQRRQHTGGQSYHALVPSTPSAFPRTQTPVPVTPSTSRKTHSVGKCQCQGWWVGEKRQGMETSLGKQQKPEQTVKATITHTLTQKPFRHQTSEESEERERRQISPGSSKTTDKWHASKVKVNRKQLLLIKNKKKQKKTD